MYRTTSEGAGARVEYPLRAPQLVLVTRVGLEQHYTSIQFQTNIFQLHYNSFISKISNYDYNYMKSETKFVQLQL